MTDYTQLDPSRVEELSKEELTEAYLQVRETISDLNAQQTVITGILIDKIEGAGEVIGNNTVSKAKRISWFPDFKTKEKLEKARELGAIKEAVDSSALKKLFEKGVDVPHNVTEYLLIKPIQTEE